jgi:tetratricopeptide (TPR) repeat protein
MRLRKWPEADVNIRQIESEGGRQAIALRAQYHRFRGDFDKAARAYRNVLQSGVTDDSIIHEYCICLRKLGEYEEVRKTIERYARNVDRNPYLLGTKVSLQLGAGEFRQAEQTIRLLASLPDSRETAAEKEAILVFKETQDYRRALAIISDAIERVKKSGKDLEPDLHSTRCLILCKLGVVDEATDDMNIVRVAHRDGEQVAQRLGIHILLSEGKSKEALDRFERMQHKTRIDSILKREIFRHLLDDHLLSLHERSEIQEKFNETLAGKPLFTEFDF